MMSILKKPEAKAETAPLGQFLLRRLKEIGCHHIFGVPGDFTLDFFSEIIKSDVNYIGTCNELNAAYAADAYARIKGIGCVATTFSVGELSAVNGIAGAYSECVPVVKIGGVPSRKDFANKTLLHHTTGRDYFTVISMYEKVTAAHTLLNDEATAAAEIDRVLKTCLREKLPVYIGVPQDMVSLPIKIPSAPFQIPPELKSSSATLKEAVNDLYNVIQSSKSPLFLPGIQISRRYLQKDFLRLLDVSGIPFTTMVLNKSVIDETHPQFIGLYCGNLCRKYIRERVHQSDCLVLWGEILTDFNTGGFTARLKRSKTTEVFYDHVSIGHRVYRHVYIHDLLRGLCEKMAAEKYKFSKEKCPPATETCIHRPNAEYTAINDKPVTVTRLMDRISHLVPRNGILIVETGVASFASTEMLLPPGATYISQSYYGSIGYTVGATLGACIAAPHRPVILIIGDGSFQVTCQDLSSIIRYQSSEHKDGGFLPPTILLLNNDGYTIERLISDNIYNDIQPWIYREIPYIFGGKREACFDVHTEGELETALATSPKDHKAPILFIEIHLDRMDCNERLRRTGLIKNLEGKQQEGSRVAKPQHNVFVSDSDAEESGPN